MQVVLLLILSWFCARVWSHDQSSPCIGTYEELVDSVRSKTINIDNLTDGFYPPNRQTTTVADIYYYINDDRSGDAPTEFKYKFRWSSSSILNLIRPELLRDASLFLYPYSEIAEMHIMIDPFCGELQSRRGDILADWESICIEKTYTVDSVILLNKLTTHVSLQIIDVMKCRKLDGAHFLCLGRGMS